MEHWGVMMIVSCPPHFTNDKQATTNAKTQTITIIKVARLVVMFSWYVSGHFTARSRSKLIPVRFSIEAPQHTMSIQIQYWQPAEPRLFGQLSWFIVCAILKGSDKDPTSRSLTARDTIKKLVGLRRRGK